MSILKQLITDMERAWQTQDADLANSLLHHDCYYYDLPIKQKHRAGREFKTFFNKLFLLFPNVVTTYLSIIEEGDIAATRWVATGYHDEKGEQTSIEGMSHFLLKDGLIGEYVVSYDYPWLSGSKVMWDAGLSFEEAKRFIGLIHPVDGKFVILEKEKRVRELIDEARKGGKLLKNAFGGRGIKENIHLSDTEKAALLLVLEGLTLQAVAKELSVNYNTLRNTLTETREKLIAKNTSEAARKARAALLI
jgi:DNA-binding CsgD family transcriptional regulator